MLVYAPGWSLARIYTPPPKIVFRSQKNENSPLKTGCACPLLSAHFWKKNLRPIFFFFFFGCFCRKICHADVDSREQQAILLKKVETFSGQNLRFSCIFLAKKWHDLVTPFSTFAYIKGSLPTESTTPDQLRCRTRTDGEDFPGFWPILFSNMNIVKKSLFQKVRHLILIYTPK